MMSIRVRIVLWLVGSLALVAALGLGANWAHDEIYDTGRARGRVEEQGRWQVERAELLRLAENARKEAQTERERRARKIQEIVDETDRRIAAADRARIDSDAAADRLRKRAAGVAARCSGTSGNTATPAASSTTTSPGDLLADMSDRVIEAARQLADVAHARLLAGEACEQSHDALRKPDPDGLRNSH